MVGVGGNTVIVDFCSCFCCPNATEQHSATVIIKPLILFVLISLPVPVFVPILFFRHAKSLWLSIDFLINPGRPDEWI